MSQLTAVEKDLLDQAFTRGDDVTRGYRACVEAALCAMRGAGMTITSVLIDGMLDRYVKMPVSLDYEEVGMSAAFMWQGAFKLWEKMQASEAPGDSAQTSWVWSVTRHASLVERRWNAFNAEFPHMFEGVWAYEVAEPFGLSIAEFMLKHGRSPSDKEAEEILEELMVMHVAIAKASQEECNGKPKAGA